MVSTVGMLVTFYLPHRKKRFLQLNHEVSVVFCGSCHERSMCSFFWPSGTKP